jgi:hypothetical protein
VIGSDVAAQVGPAYCFDKRGIVAHLGSHAADDILLAGAWTVKDLVDEMAHEVDALRRESELLDQVAPLYRGPCDDRVEASAE